MKKVITTIAMFFFISATFAQSPQDALVLLADETYSPLPEFLPDSIHIMVEQLREKEIDMIVAYGTISPDSSRFIIRKIQIQYHHHQDATITFLNETGVIYTTDGAPNVLLKMKLKLESAVIDMPMTREVYYNEKTCGSFSGLMNMFARKCAHSFSLGREFCTVSFVDGLMFMN